MCIFCEIPRGSGNILYLYGGSVVTKQNFGDIFSQ